MGDRVVRHVRGQIVAGVSDPGENLGGVPEQIWRPLVGLAAHEAVEVVEAHADRPLVERSRHAVLIARRVVVLAEPGCGVAVLLQDRADGGALRSDDAVVARIAGGLLRNDAEADRVVVAAGDQRRPRRRAECRGVELSVAQPHLRNAIHRRRRDDAAERPRNSIALVVGHDQEHVGRTLGRHHAGGPIRFRLAGLKVDLAAELRWRRRKILSIDRRGGAG